MGPYSICHSGWVRIDLLEGVKPVSEVVFHCVEHVFHEVNGILAVESLLFFKCRRKVLFLTAWNSHQSHFYKEKYAGFDLESQHRIVRAPVIHVSPCCTTFA